MQNYPRDIKSMINFTFDLYVLESIPIDEDNCVDLE